MLLGVFGCASRAASASGSASPKAGSAAGAQSDDPGPRPSDAAAAAAYYREHEAALKQPLPQLAPGTDVKRLRRGRLYADVPPVSGELHKALGAALQKSDVPAAIDAATKILTLDPLDVRARMMLTVLLRDAGRTAEVDAHKAIAQALLDSILGGGDGKSFGSAWTVFQVVEEYGALDALGFEVEAQSLRHEGDRDFDVLQAKNTETGETIEAYFDITELFAEEARALSGR